MALFTGQPTHSQQVALALAPKFTACLSIIGSGVIIADVCRRRKQNTRATYHRLMFGMSACDIIVSFGFFLSTWTMPKGTPYVWGALGNTQTCSFQGFIEQIGVAAVMYNGSLSIYYLLTIRNNWAMRRILRLEPWLHAVPLVFGISTMIAGLFLKLYNYGIFDCWIAPYPNDCDESFRNGGVTNCERGDNASLYQFVFGLGVKWATIFLVTVCMFLVFQRVSKTERAQRRYGFEGQAAPSQETWLSASSSMVQSNAPAAQQSSSFSNTVRTAKKKSCSQQVAQQAYLYVGTLYLTWFPVVILRVIQFVTGVTHYEMIMLVAIAIPSQGFWNCCVYLRPRYLKLREEQKARHREADAARVATQSSVAVEAVMAISRETASALHAISSAVREGDLDSDDEPLSDAAAVECANGAFLDEETALEQENTGDRYEDPLAF